MFNSTACDAMDSLPEQGGDGPPGSLSPIEDFDYDSSGSLSSLDSAFGELSDSPVVSPQPASPGPNFVPVKRKRGRPRRADVAPPPPLSRRRQRQPAAPSPRPAAAADAADGAPDAAGLVTTGAFLTRTTLRKLGVADILAGPETPEAGLDVGSRVKVLSLDKKWYTAAVLAIGSGRALVHYPAWDHCYNEWIPVDSRRILHRGKPDPGVGGSTEALAMLHAECAAGPVLAGPELARAIGDAFGTPPSTAVASDPAPALPTPRAKGRPPGSRNCRRAGHIKSRGRGSRQPAATASDQPASPEAESPAAPEVPEELRIPEVRMARAADNPYRRRHQLEEIFGADSGQCTGPGGWAGEGESAASTASD
ncbi:hypothetical protein H4R19_004835, partial [Coemansia spiralis]